MTTENSNKNPQKSDPGSDSESEDVFHDARFPAEEEAVSCRLPLSQEIVADAHIGHLNSAC
jgi:hypothetical protein